MHRGDGNGSRLVLVKVFREKGIELAHNSLDNGEMTREELQVAVNRDPCHFRD